jgi:hypothetical protein
MAKRKFKKKEIPPNAGLDLLPHLIAFSSTFRMPKFFENFIKSPLIRNEKAIDKIPKMR